MSSFLRTVFLAPLMTGCIHMPSAVETSTGRADLHGVVPVKLRRIKGGGLSPTSSKILVDFSGGSTKYDWYRKDGRLCRGETTLETSKLIPVVQRIKLCRDQMDTVHSDGMSDYLGVEWNGSPREPPLTSLIIHAEKNPAFAGEQIISCRGLEELDQTLESLLPCP